MPVDILGEWCYWSLTRRVNGVQAKYILWCAGTQWTLELAHNDIYFVSTPVNEREAHGSERGTESAYVLRQ